MNLNLNKFGQLLFLFFFGFHSFATFAAESNSEILRKVWDIGAREACAPEMRAAFNETNYENLRSQLGSETDLERLKDILNPFLRSFGWSHTEFWTRTDESFYFFRGHSSSVNPENPPAPELINPGVQLGRDGAGYFIREVLDGFPAQMRGVRKNDRIVSWLGRPFTGSWGEQGVTGELVLQRGQNQLSLTVAAQSHNWDDIFLEAMKRSERILVRNGKRIGYVNLWSGVHKDSATVLKQIVESLASQGIDGLILDLRGGYGGAWWEHLEPFFTDQTGFFSAESFDGANQPMNVTPDAHHNEKAYLGPMAVLINEGSRSGKEALAYQFKKSNRATLVGTKTPGYFSGGGYYFTEEPVDYVLYLCIYRTTLDGNTIERIGITPNIIVPFENSGSTFDSQLEAALDQLVLSR